ncbi:hypothetical protein [Xanthomonas phage XPV1]|uniref:Uncharacterized protein n=1 Tax=Xanthomonas phage XPV1 TaxID=2099860 RepID=A0A3S7I6A6_9CAUD|nr:hypothetical protein KEM12_gp14 [Xanthomonas phage XPV1]AVO24178.1 hypothetical protein [Xanthomonas phage XPV1]AVO24297.1 hypothetical protein [Xanthomonas phage XPV2]
MTYQLAARRIVTLADLDQALAAGAQIEYTAHATRAGDRLSDPMDSGRWRRLTRAQIDDTFRAILAKPWMGEMVRAFYPETLP